MASVTRQAAKIDITVSKRDTSQYLQEMKQVLSQFSSFESRRRIAESASQIVIDSARRMAQSSFKNQEKHYTYNTPKLMRRIKAPAGQGVVTGEYAPGNLMRSIIDIAKRRSIYKKKTYKVIIGPYYRGRGPLGGKARAVFNSMSKIDGYYAHMVYGSAKAFQSRIMIPALKQVQVQVLNEMRREADRILQGEAQKTKYVKATKEGTL
jgi:hypothetical protein